MLVFQQNTAAYVNESLPKLVKVYFGGAELHEDMEWINWQESYLSAIFSPSFLNWHTFELMYIA